MSLPVWLLVLLTVSFKSYKFSYPKGSLPCKVYNTTSLDCSYRELTRIPLLNSHNVMNVEHIDLSHNQLFTVDGTNFVHLSSLRILNLTRSMIKQVTFDKPSSLKVLDLSYNDISNITSVTFSGLHELEILNLRDQGWNSNAFIFRLHIDMFESPFQSMPLLKSVNIRWSFLEDVVHRPIFQGLHELEELDVSYNLVCFAGSVFRGMADLKHLDMHYNSLPFRYNSTPPGDLFQGLVSLEYLDISSCGIACLEENIFTDLINLKYINISLNGFTCMPCKAIEPLKSLTIANMSLISSHMLLFFDLHSNCPPSFKQLTSLTEKIVSSSCAFEYWNATRWIELFAWLPDSVSSLHLHISPNGVLQSTIFAGYFYPYQFIKQLRIEPNMICIRHPSVAYNFSIGNDAFVMFKELVELRIFNFPSISIDKYAFAGLLNLRILFLSNNGFVQIPEEVLKTNFNGLPWDPNWARLKYLDLSRNRISNMLRLSDIIKVEILTVDHNSFYLLDLPSFGDWTLATVFAICINPENNKLDFYSNQFLQNLYLSAKSRASLSGYNSKNLCNQFVNTSTRYHS